MTITTMIITTKRESRSKSVNWLPSNNSVSAPVKNWKSSQNSSNSNQAFHKPEERNVNLSNNVSNTKPKQSHKLAWHTSHKCTKCTPTAKCWGSSLKATWGSALIRLSFMWSTQLKERRKMCKLCWWIFLEIKKTRDYMEQKMRSMTQRISSLMFMYRSSAFDFVWWWIVLAMEKVLIKK